MAAINGRQMTMMWPALSEIFANAFMKAIFSAACLPWKILSGTNPNRTAINVTRRRIAATERNPPYILTAFEFFQQQQLPVQYIHILELLYNLLF